MGVARVGNLYKNNHKGLLNIIKLYGPTGRGPKLIPLVDDIKFFSPEYQRKMVSSFNKVHYICSVIQ